MTTYTPTAQRASGGTDVHISIGVLTMQFDLVPQARSNKQKDTSLKLVCPEPHTDGELHRGDQQYRCPEGHIYTQATAARARELDDGRLVKIDKDAAAEARTGGKDTGILELHVHPSSDVAGACRPGAKGYRLRPGKVKSKVPAKALEMYGVLRDLVATRPEIALVGELLLKGTRSFYRVEVWGDQLMLAELVHPADLAERDTIDVDADPGVVAKMGQLVDSYMEDWDPGLHRFDAKAALDELAEASAGEPGAMATVTPISAAVDLDSFFDQVLEARRSA